MSVKKSTFGYFFAVALVCAAVVGGCFLFSRSVTAFSASELRSAQPCIVIDAGHGGVDGGATSCTGKLESAYNLEIALRLRDLCHLLGYPTRMIRTTDTSVYTKGNTIAAQKMSDLKERVRVVNESERNLLVSIHQNNFSDSRYSGAQVFYAGTEGSRELAEALQSALTKSLNPISKRKVKKAEGIYLMEHITNPGILVECGFLSNPEEEAKLNDPDYQKKLCCVIAATVCSWVAK